jgi:hypothetical protein
MEKYKKGYYRCGCCDVAFDSYEKCREHFESIDHKIVAFPAFVKFWSAQVRGARAKKKYIDNVLTSW